jgi:hypothetical protein
MKYLVLLSLLVSCEKTNNRDFKVELLFIHDSCKVYRFIDGNQHRYFSKCTEITKVK